MGVVGCYALNLAHSWWLLLIVYVISKLGYSSSLIFYDAMLTDITTKDAMIIFLPWVMLGAILEVLFRLC